MELVFSPRLHLLAVLTEEGSFHYPLDHVYTLKQCSHLQLSPWLALGQETFQGNPEATGSTGDPVKGISSLPWGSVLICASQIRKRQCFAEVIALIANNHPVFPGVCWKKGLNVLIKVQVRCWPHRILRIVTKAPCLQELPSNQCLIIHAWETGYNSHHH